MTHTNTHTLQSKLKVIYTYREKGNKHRVRHRQKLNIRGKVEESWRTAIRIQNIWNEVAAAREGREVTGS